VTSVDFFAHWESWFLVDFRPDAMERSFALFSRVIQAPGVRWLRRPPERVLFGPGIARTERPGPQMRMEPQLPAVMTGCHVLVILETAPPDLAAIARARAVATATPVLDVGSANVEQRARAWLELYYRPSQWEARRRAEL
jgi:hypothetical protein